MRSTIFAVLAMTALTACAGEEEEEDGSLADREANIASLTGDAAAGETTYAANCAGCHGADGSGGDPGPNIVGAEAEEVAEYVLYGEDEMPAFAASLEDQDIADIIAFLNQ